MSFRLVDARMKLDQARLMAHHAARLADAGMSFSTEASRPSWRPPRPRGSRPGRASDARRLLVLAEYPVERWLRNAKLEELYEGTNDIQRLIIGRSLFQT